MSFFLFVSTYDVSPLRANKRRKDVSWVVDQVQEEALFGKCRVKNFVSLLLLVVRQLRF